MSALPPWMTRKRLALALLVLLGGPALGVTSWKVHHPPAGADPAAAALDKPAPAAGKTTDLPAGQPTATDDSPESGPDEQRDALGQPRSDSQLDSDASLPPQRRLTISRGDSLRDLLRRAGLSKAEATAAEEALDGHYNARGLRPGQKVTALYERQPDGSPGALKSFTFSTDPESKVILTREASGFSVREVKVEVRSQMIAVSGKITSSLYETALKQGLPVSILEAMIHALSYDVDFQRDIEDGDVFEVVYERLIDPQGQAVRSGNLLYANLVLSGSPTPIYRFVDSGGTADFYTPKGESVRKTLLRTPVDGARITSGFGNRTHPILGYTKMHKGIDFGVSTGTPVMSAGNGVVEQAGPYSSYGNYLRIRHDSVHSTAYAHLSRFAAGVKPGKHVTQGQIVAYSGSTGRSSGPHLHYEIIINGNQVNPMSVKFQSGTKLGGRELEKFKGLVATVQDAFKKKP